MANRKRTNHFLIRLNDEELKQLAKNMQLAGIINREAYVRQRILNEGAIKVHNISTSPNKPALRELIRLLSNATNNINQIAKRANESRNVYTQDIIMLKDEVEELKALVRKKAEEL